MQRRWRHTRAAALPALLPLLAPLARPAHGKFSEEDKLHTARVYGNIGWYEYYFIDLMIGKPAQRTSVIVDTGSQITGFPCETCVSCGPNHLDLPLYDINKSTTGKWLGCDDKDCHSGDCDNGHCKYQQGYYEGSAMEGWWIRDWVQVDDLRASNPPIQMPIGCHRKEDKLFYTQLANGIMGIRPPKRGTPTIFDAMFAHTESVNKQIFSLCFAEWGGMMTVGGYNASYHRGPIEWLKLSTWREYYDVTLSKISLGNATLHDSFASVMVDSGTTYTFFPETAYDALKNAIETYCAPGQPCVSSFRRDGAAWPWQNGTCYPETMNRTAIFPIIDFWFEGAKVQWKPEAYMFHSEKKNRFCYGFANDKRASMTTLGATFMTNSDFVFDMTTNKLGIAPASCPEFKHRPYLPRVTLVEGAGQEIDEWTTLHRPAPHSWSYYLWICGVIVSVVMCAVIVIDPDWDTPVKAAFWLHAKLLQAGDLVLELKRRMSDMRDRAMGEPRAEAKKERRDVKRQRKAKLLTGEDEGSASIEFHDLATLEEDDCPMVMEEGT